jgi:hypothetical protein
MSAEDVEAVCESMFVLSDPPLSELTQVLTDALEESVITRIAAASAEQLALLRDIRAAVAANSVSVEEIQQLDTYVSHIERGPLYFNVIVIIYEKWAKEYRAYLSSLGSPMPSTPGSDEEEGSDEDWRDMLPSTRRTGAVRVGDGQNARVATLLAAMLNVHRYTLFCEEFHI